MNRHAKRGLRVTGPSSKDSAAGGRPSVTVPDAKPETEATAVIADYWADAKRRYQRGDYVDYGSDDWKALPIEDPRKMAGLVAFAQMWLRYGDEIAADLNRQLTTPEPLWQRATTEACDTAWRQLLAKQQRTRKEAA
ncbi:hypothetical protein ACIQRE_27505 [Streptomyces griseoluteus]|uniref:hypothetical protein n=1 Tax=Streptomyces griseoluteus TaxID=29306 RepID=UPI0037F1F856